ncbi:hypothetical protein HG535_0C00660 [Zygotorulaspora mrakii]|uniref:F-box domain-containing protein n=1 Tax=Zygotorulaspora mrakii TaxID=42260 RepID=A0A7H9AZT9_ZYGMR|nr:uncharacterized protein HG535_0C00660 [Zygotorulaspora mrakii]QLG71717.1 hypothetical protein HG535_0C00660 [Zygotorulaspora mrakii]
MVNETSFPLQRLPDELVNEVFSHLPQQDRLSVCLLNKRMYPIGIKLIYRRIYLNDSNVVRSDYMSLAINWTLLSIPALFMEQQSRFIANLKLRHLIDTLKANKFALNCVQWVRINWDLSSDLQRSFLSILCSEGESLQRLENVTDPSTNDIIANGRISSEKLTSFDMAPPNPLPECTISEDYIPNLRKYMQRRISSKLSHMTLFIDPLKLFNYLHPLREKLQIVDLKLHWRREFYDSKYFKTRLRKYPLQKLSDIFEVKTLKTLTIISWIECLVPGELQMIKDFGEFIYLEDLSLISIKQNFEVLVSLFYNLENLKRLKMDFLEDYLSEATNPEIFLTILVVCTKLQFIDMRYEAMTCPIISPHDGKYTLNQNCYCSSCNHVFENILRKKIFLLPEDIYTSDGYDGDAKDIFKMMRVLSLLPYSKACDCYPSVRTHPMDLNEFVKKMNSDLFSYRQIKSQLNPVEEQDHDIAKDFLEYAILSLPHAPLTCQDIINCYHALIHHYKKTYIAFLKGFPELRFLMLNDIPSVVVEENSERVFQPVFYHGDFKTNLTGWSQASSRNTEHSNSSVIRKVTLL